MSEAHQMCLARVVVAAVLCVSCTPTPPAPIVTSVGKSVATLEKFSGMTGCTTTPPPPPAPQAWWNAMPPQNHQYPFAGWETWRNLTGGCANTRIDVYRAVVSFNLASVSHLKGLVRSAELRVSSHAVPPAAGPGGAVTVGTSPNGVTLFCPQNIGGAGSLVRFGPNAVVPRTSGTGMLTELGSDPFPTGSGVVYTLPQSRTIGPIPGATSPSTLSVSGDGRAVISTDVTGAVTAALNANASSLSWMLTSNFEGLLPGQLPASGTVDCRTGYAFDLLITHL